MEQGRCVINTKTEVDVSCEISPCTVKNTSASSVASFQSAEIVENQYSVKTFSSPTAEKIIKPLSDEIVESQDLANLFASPTPERAIQPSRCKNKGTTLPLRAVKQLSKSYQNEEQASENEAVDMQYDLSEDEEVESYGKTEDEELQVPDKYKTLVELFDRIDTSVRLLNLRKKLPTFQNICHVVEAMTKRNLSHRHLAQMKYMLPEAIKIDKILSHDEKTLCMVPDMKVALLLDVIEARSDQSPFMALRQIFHSRLIDFSKSYPEASDIPLAMLPEPFSQRSDGVHSGPLTSGSAVDSHSTPVDDDSNRASLDSEPLLVSSLSHSIRSHFSQRINVPETEKTSLLASSLVTPLPGNSGDHTVEEIKNPEQEEHSSLVSNSISVTSPAALIFSPQRFISSGTFHSSPLQDSLLAHPLIVETPAQPTPLKRTLPISDEKIETETRKSSPLVAKRSLDFSLLKGDRCSLIPIDEESQQHMDNRLKRVPKDSVFAEVGFTASPSGVRETDHSLLLWGPLFFISRLLYLLPSQSMEQGRCVINTKTEVDVSCEISPCTVKNTSASSVASFQSAEIVENQYSVKTFSSPTAEKIIKPLSDEIVESQDLANLFASPTPERAIQPSRCKNKGTTLPLRAVKQLSKSYQNEEQASENEAVDMQYDLSEDEEVESYGKTEDEELQVPDKYKTLVELFDRIDTSVRLLNLRKKLPTFQNICHVVEAMTKRNLSHRHLAQMKYMLPEAIKIDKILIHDEKTLWMVPDMKVALLLDVIEARSDQSPFMALRQIFHSRLIDFSKSYPEASDIPLAMLPEPFSQRSDGVHSGPLTSGSAVDSHSTPVDDDSNRASLDSEPLLVSSLSHSIRSHFSQRINVPETEKTSLVASLVTPLPGNSGDRTVEEIKNPEQEEHSSLVSKSISVTSPAALIFSPQRFISSGTFHSSPLQDSLLAYPLIVETPAQPTPLKRTLPISDEKIETETRKSSPLVAKRSLDFSLLKGDRCSLIPIDEESQQHLDNRLKTVPKDSVFAEVGFTASPSGVPETVGTNADYEMIQTGLVKREQFLDLFNIIYNIFQSVNCPLITKEELLQKIITHNLNIVESREAEEQLRQLIDLVPDWICQKSVPGGDIFYSITKVSDLESIRARLAEAV